MSARKLPTKTSLFGTRDRPSSRTRTALSSALVVALYVCLASWLVATTFLTGWAIGLSATGQSVAIPDDVRDRVRWARVPSGWEDMTRKQVRRHFKCKARDADQDKALPTTEEWRLMRAKFRDAVNPGAAFDDAVPPTEGYALYDDDGSGGGGRKQPYYAKSSEGRGRGLFATRDIAKGEVVHDGERSDVVFPDGAAWRRYIFSLPRDLACDTTSWNWTQEREGGAFELRSSLNIAILMNGGGTFGSNIRPLSSRSVKFVATRDIAKDEEIMYDYKAYKTKWSAFGL